MSINIDKNWICRDYEEGDEKQILDLFKTVFGKTIALPFWRWRFVENPFGQGIIKLLFDKNKLIGHYAVTPMIIQVKEKPVKSVFSMTTMTHPDYQRRGIFTYLAVQVYRACVKKGFKFVYGFPNKNSYHGFINNLQWRDLGKMTILYKELKENLPIYSQKNNNIYEIKNFTEDVELLWNKVGQYFDVILPRVKDYLNWRFNKNPTVNYKIYGIKNNKIELCGYIVLKSYAKEKETIGHIVDILSVNDDAVIRGLLNNSYNYFLQNQIKKISCWMPKSCFYSAVMEKEKFIRVNTETDTYFGVKIFDEKNDSLKFVEFFDNWYLTMSDSDVF